MSFHPRGTAAFAAVCCALVLALAPAVPHAQSAGGGPQVLPNEDDSDDAIAAEDDGDGDAADDDWELLDEPEVADAGTEDEGDTADLDGAPDRSVEADGFLRPPPGLPLVGKPPRDESARATPSGEPVAPRMSMRSTGGQPVRDGAAPWQAQLYAPFPPERWSPASRAGREPWELQHYCGGALIARDWVLTAAHCVYAGMEKAGFRIRVGTEDIVRREGTSFAIDRIVVHPGWKGGKGMYHDDIALIRIVADKPEVAGRSLPYATIPLHRGGVAPPDGAAVTATGWGKTKDVELEKFSSVLMKVDLNVMAEPRCAALPTYGPEKIHSKVLCAAAPGRQTCRGDSGGPVVFTNGTPVLVGVVSWGKARCTGDGQPGVYTRVAAYAPWIDSVIRATAR